MGSKREGAQAAWELVEAARLEGEPVWKFAGFRLSKRPRAGHDELTEMQAKAFTVTVHRCAKWFEHESTK